ncbi:MAG: hypothetical protein ACC661_01950 [Verrucomicrobiales bacterium]
MKRPPVHRRLASVLLALMIAGGGGALAILDEAHSFAMEAAARHVPKGFTVREDYWNGELKAGEKKIIRHQLFKGNEYWFWLGSSADGAWPSLSIYDLDGRPVEVERFQELHMAAARVLPPRTGSYLIMLTVDSKESEIVDWALAYGFR